MTDYPKMEAPFNRVPVQNDLLAHLGTIGGLKQATIQVRWEHLQSLIKTVCEDSVKYIELLLDLEDDTVVANGAKVLLGMKRAPAAKGNHHNFEGGLVYHYLEMWYTWKVWSECFMLECAGYINDDRVLRAIINHDLHKAHRTFKLISTDPWEVDYAKDYSDKFVSTDLKSIQLLSRRGIELDGQQMNALLWAEGGFSKVRPEWCTALAKLCYLLDEFSGNVLGRIAKGTLIDLRTPHWDAEQV